LGIESVRIVDPYDLKTVRTVIKEELARSGPSVVISRRACVLFKREMPTPRKPFRIDPERCTGCRLCLGLGCPPIAWQKIEIRADEAMKEKKEKERGGISVIERNLCTGCGLCEQLCKSDAITEEKE
jgi:indolepyruvate ferredoxin oxidoreductase, alpha subunit